MRILDPAVAAAYEEGRIVKRNLIWIKAKHPDTGDPVSVGFWDDDETRDLAVVDAVDDYTFLRTFKAAGGVIEVGSIPLTSDLSVRNVSVTLSPLNADVETLLRGHDLRNAPIQLYRPMFDPDTFEVVAEAEARFVGFIEKAPIFTPAEGGEAKATLQCVSHTAELTRTNPDVRSDESQKRRSGDRFYRYVSAMPQRVVYWGSKPK